MASEVDLWPTVPALLGGKNYCALATADGEGTPWATPMFFAARGERELFWVSSTDSRHSRNIAVRPKIAITVFDSADPIGGAEALYLEAVAMVPDAALQQCAIDVLNGKLPAHQALTRSDLHPGGALQVYRAAVERHFVLVRGSDERFDNVVDQRREVHPTPGAAGHGVQAGSRPR